MKDLIMYAMKPVVYYNSQRQCPPEFQGISFSEGPNGATAYVAANEFVVRFNGVPKPVSPFFSYLKNCWTPKSEFPQTNEKISSMIDACQSEVAYSAVTPISNLMNWLTMFPQDVAQKSRLVFSPGRLPAENELILDFDQNGRASVQGINFFVSQRSTIQRIIPGAQYICGVVSENGNNVEVDVREAFARIRLGAIFSNGLYLPEDTRQIDSLSTTDYVYPLNHVQERFTGVEMCVPHMDMQLFTLMLQLCSFTDSTTVEIGFSVNPMKAICLRTQPGLLPSVELAVMPLDPRKVGQRR